MLLLVDLKWTMSFSRRLEYGARTPEGKARQTAGRIAYYAARRAAGLQPLPRKPNDASRTSPKRPEAKSVNTGPKVTLTPEDIEFGYLTGMLKK